MLISRTLGLLRARGNVLRSLAVGSARNASGGGDSYVQEYKDPTMDDLPVPSGSWKEAHDRTQRRYNLYLVSSVVFFIITLGVGKQTGTLDLYTGPDLKNK